MTAKPIGEVIQPASESLPLRWYTWLVMAGSILGMLLLCFLLVKNVEMGLGDLFYNVNGSIQIDERGAYLSLEESNRSFFYAPPMVVLLKQLKPLDTETTRWVWLVVNVLLVPVCAFAMLKLMGVWRDWRAWGVAFLAVVCMKLFIEWDLLAMNINLIVLLMTVIAMLWVKPSKWGMIGGFLLALAFMVKLYPVVMVVWLIWKRRWWAMLGWVIGVLLTFGLLPILDWGLTDSVSIYQSWIVALRSAGHPEAPLIIFAALSSLHRAIQFSFAGQEGEGGVLSLEQVVYILRVIQILWTLLVGLLFVLLMRAKDISDVRRLGLVFSLLWLWLVPMSPILQAHQMLCLWPATLILLLGVVERGRAWYWRALLFAPVLASFMSYDVILPPIDYRGFVFAGSALVLALGLGMMVWIPRPVSVVLTHSKTNRSS